MGEPRSDRTGNNLGDEPNLKNSKPPRLQHQPSLNSTYSSQVRDIQLLLLLTGPGTAIFPIPAALVALGQTGRESLQWKVLGYFIFFFQGAARAPECEECPCVDFHPFLLPSLALERGQGGTDLE